MPEETAAFAILCKAGLLGEDNHGYYLAHDWLHMVLADERAAPESLPSASKYFIGLTGNIATGKSTVLHLLEQLGAQIIDADQLVHQLREPGAAGYHILVARYGRSLLLADGRIDAQALAKRAFAEPAFLAELEAIFHPLVGEEFDRLVQTSQQPVSVIEAIKLLEGQLKARVHAIWVVHASRETQIQRLINDRGLSHDAAVPRVDSQNPQAEKLAQADVVIDNDGDLSQTRRQILDAWEDVLNVLARRKSLTETMVRRFIHVSLKVSGAGIAPDTALDMLRQITRRSQGR